MYNLRLLRMGVVMAIALVAMAACGSSSTASKVGAPIVVGNLLELSGPFAANGKQLEDGWNLGLHDFGSSVDGHKIDTIFEDEQGDPTVALSDARQLVGQDHAALLEGPVIASASAVVDAWAGPLGVPIDDIGPCSITTVQTYQKYHNGYGSAWNCDQPASIMAQWAYDQGYRHIATIGMDYSFGWQTVGTFDAAFTKLGGTIIQGLWAPITTADWSPYITQISNKADAVFALVAGAESVSFTDTYGQLGMAKKIPLIGDTTLFDQSVLQSENPSYVVGQKMAAQYCDGINTPVNKTFVREVHNAYGDYPGYYTDAGYIKAERLVDALKKLHGVVKSGQSLIKALKSVSLQAPTGLVKLSPVTSSPIQNIYICQVTQAKDGSLHNTPIKVFKDVQPWGILSQSQWLSVFSHDSTARPA